MSTEITTNHNEWNRERIELVKRTFCKGATDDELQLFIATCKKLGLSPEARQIFAVKRWDSKERKEVMSIQTSIDGHRLVAERTGEYEGQTEPQWCGDDGIWKDCWLSSLNPKASRVGVYKKGFKTPLFATAHWDEFVQTSKEGNLAPMWRKMPRLMISKCAESLALRKAFPNELSGVYTSDEMGQAQASEHEPAHIIAPIQEKPQVIESAKADLPEDVQPKKYIFDSKNPKAVEWLEKQLAQKNIAKDEWLKISDDLDGKDVKELENIIKPQKEIIENAASVE